MKTLRNVLFLVALAGLVGCQQSTPPGGPGATDKNKPATDKNKPDAGKRDTGLTTPENSFRLTLPNLETSIKQGEKKTVTIGISRGKNFDQDVKLSFGNPPKGVTITPETPALKASEKEDAITIEADKDAALGEHTITVTGTPAKSGDKTSADLKIKVVKP